MNQQKAKLIDLEANVSLQERSNGKVDLSPSQHPILKPLFLSKAASSLFTIDKYFQLSEDFKKMSETLTENKASMDQKLEKLEGTKKELVLAVSDMGKANTTLGQELASLTGLKTKAPAWDRKAETTEVDNSSSPHSQLFIPGGSTEHLADGGGEQDTKGDERVEEESRGDSDRSLFKEGANRASGWPGPA